jgi:MbtH protein
MVLTAAQSPTMVDLAGDDGLLIGVEGMADNSISTAYTVVMNGEEQYSIWPVDRAVPAGWHEVGTRGNEEACLAYIEENWTDMRPLSVRRAMTNTQA